MITKNELKPYKWEKRENRKAYL